MNTPIRAALAALTGAAMLLVASCSSSTAESAPASTASVTASAWVKPLESASGSALPSSDATEGTQAALDGSTVGTPGPTTGSIAGPDATAVISEMPIPVGLTPEESNQARAALDAFRTYWALTDDLAADPSRDWSLQISATATGAAANFRQQSVDQLRAGGWRGTGRTSVQITVTRVQAGAVDLTTCVDVSTHDIVNQEGASYKTQKDPSALSQFRGNGQVGQYESGWKVNSYLSYPATPC